VSETLCLTLRAPYFYTDLLFHSLANTQPGDRCQFERLGYFCVDSKDSKPDAPVFNRTVTLRDTWAKILKAQRK
jgi:glutaminyl-tRNA synthetase